MTRLEILQAWLSQVNDEYNGLVKAKVKQVKADAFIIIDEYETLGAWGGFEGLNDRLEYFLEELELYYEIEVPGRLYISTLY